VQHVLESIVNMVKLPPKMVEYLHH
jgi:hypothetical protein